MNLAETVAHARAALLAAGAPVDPLDQAWGAPWRVALVGAQGVGKTTLVNRLTGGDAPTGLGGVTRAVREVALPGVVLVDLPALDDPAWPARVVAAADAAIWLVDGLRPLPRSELDQVAAAGLPATLHVRITRLDLVEPSQVDEVFARVTSCVAPFSPQSLGRLDPRRDPPPWGLVVRSGAGRARLAAVLGTARRAREALPRPEGDGPIAAWHAAVRRAGTRLDEVPLAAVAREAAGVLPPDLTVPALPEESPSVLARIVGGEASARRARRAALARWAAEVELALREWVTARDAPRREADEALARLEETLADTVTTVP